MEVYNAVSRFVFIEGHSHREAARQFGISREDIRFGMLLCPGRELDGILGSCHMPLGLAQRRVGQYVYQQLFGLMKVG